MDTQTLAAAQEIDFSLLTLFMKATFTNKLVLMTLMGMSFWSWSIIVQRLMTFRRARTESEEFDRAFWSGEPLDELYETIAPDPQGASQRIFAAGMTEWRRSHRQDGGLIAGAQARIDRAMDVAIAREAESLNKGLAFLATTGSTAPFIGLFGTVWGIMSSFLAISAEGTTNLAVVAPGIAEALLVTGFGLVAAIPAVVVYNWVQRRIAALRQGMADMAVALEVLLSRDLDRRAAR